MLRSLCLLHSALYLLCLLQRTLATRALYLHLHLHLHLHLNSVHVYSICVCVCTCACTCICACICICIRNCICTVHLQIVVISSNIGHENCHTIKEWPLSKAVNYTGEPHRSRVIVPPPPP